METMASPGLVPQQARERGMRLSPGRHVTFSREGSRLAGGSLRFEARGRG